MENFNNISSTFDMACQYCQAVSQLDQIGSATMNNVAEIEPIIQQVLYATSGDDPQFQEILATAAGQKISAAVAAQVNQVVSDYQITVANPYYGLDGNYDSANIQVQFASDSYYEGGDTVTYSGPMTLANFDPNARVGFILHPTILPNSDGDIAYDSNYAPWMPPADPDGPYASNGAEYEMGEDVFWGTSYNPPWGDTVDTGGENGQFTSLVGSFEFWNYDPQPGQYGWQMNMTVNASDFEQFMSITPTASAGKDLSTLVNMIG